MPLIPDPRAAQLAIVGPVRGELFAPDALRDAPRPPILDTLAAASRQATLPAGAFEFAATSTRAGVLNRGDVPEGFDPLDDIAGFEDEAARFVDADSPEQVAALKARIGQERRDRETLARAGLGGPIASVALNLADPSFLAAIAVPELALAKGVRMGRVLNAAAQGVTAAGTYELGMHALHPDRTLSESAINVGAGALLSGVLGALGRRVPKTERDAFTEAVRREIAPDVRSEVGAARAAVNTTLEQETIARGGQTLEKLFGAVPLARTDAQIVLHSESAEARRVLQELADVAPILTKHEQGIASPTSVESLVGRHEGRVADFIEHMRGAWIQYRERVPRAERMSREDFHAGVAAAARRGDENLVPEIADAAKFLRARVFDPLKVEAQQLGLLPADVEVKGADSYFRRMYDRDAIRAERREWDSILTKHFMRRGVEYAEARSVAEDITRRILGADVGVANFNMRTVVPDAGPLHERVLDIPDELLERFLVNDPVKVAGAYVRELAPQIEVTKRFGDKDMKAAFDHIRDEYDVLRERHRVTRDRREASPELTRLGEQEKQTLEALTRIRDRIYGRAGRLEPGASSGERLAVQALRGWRNLVASARLGGTAVVAGATDTARIAAQYGFLPTVGRIAKLATSPAFRSMSREQARRVGAAVEVAMARRVTVAFDGAATEGWTQKLANGVYKISGLNHWTDFARTVSVTLLEDRVLKAATDVAGGRLLPKWTRTRLAQLGLDTDDLKRIASEVQKHGGDVDGVRVSGSAHWDDAELAARYDGALLKEARTTVMQPGAADRVWWMDSETGRVLGQLKSFALASPMKLAMVPAQQIGQGQAMLAARFVGYMLAGGALVHVLRNYGAGRQPTTDPGELAAEAFVESGIGGVLPDLISPIARRFGVLGESARYSDRNVLSTYGGPALGTVADAYDLAFNRTANGMSARDLHLLRRLMPMQNVWYLRRAINALEGESAEALGLEGAEARTFGARFTETAPLLPAEERGGTGTGALVY